MYATMRILVVLLLLTTITMVSGFQAAKVSTAKPTKDMFEISMHKKSSGIHNTDNDRYFVDSPWNLPMWIEKSAQVVSTMVVGWTLAASMAMATNTELLTTTALSIMDESILVPVVETTTESMSQDSVKVTETSAPTINEVAVDAMFLNTGMSQRVWRLKQYYSLFFVE